MVSFERRRFWRTIVVGVVLTLIACAADQLGLLSALDDWFYDNRALYCQFFTPKPDERIVHVDIDDASLEPGAIGRWPWTRGTLARIVEEIGRAKPAAIALDLHLIDPENPDEGIAPTTNPTGDYGDDAALAKSLAQQKNAVLAVTFEVKPPQTPSPEQTIALEELSSNLELDFPGFISAMRSRGIDLLGRDDARNLFEHTLTLAMRERVTKALQTEPLTDEQLRARLLPHLASGIRAPVLTLLKVQAEAFRGRQEFRRFGIEVPQLPLPAVSADFSKVPLPIFARGAAYCGFVNYDFFNSSTVRLVPMMVESEHKLYPQFGLVIACAVLGVDIHQIRVEKDQIVIPRSDGAEMQIPTHSFHSTVLHRDFSNIADIPWFGSSDWQTMYDWPNHRSPRNHITANVVWDICRTIDKINRNNSDIDDAIHFIMSDDGYLGLDDSFAKKYAGSQRAPDDYEVREKAAQYTIQSLNDSGWLDSFARMPSKTPQEKQESDDLNQQLNTLKAAVQSNRGLRGQLADLRSDLSARLAGKGVLLGWTAEGESDVVNTSIIYRCPGVVVHGLIAESVLSGRWWHRAPSVVGIGFVLLLGFATATFVARLSPLRCAGATMLLALSYLLLNGLFFFDFGGWIVPIAGSVVAISVVWSGCTLDQVIFESIERNRVATEVAIISREMDLAHKVQAELIPKQPPNIPGLEAEGWTLPADKTGGDCYDLWPLSDGRLAILVADASGHGLAPAMIVSQVRTLLRALSELEFHPSDLLRRVNARVAEDLESGRFVTVFLGFLSPDGLLEYASAGHGPQFLFGSDGELVELNSTGAPLGFDTEWLCDDPGPPIQIGEGGNLVVFSDGIFEAMNPKAELFGIDRLKEILDKTRQQPTKLVVQKLIDAVLQWQQSSTPSDDQTIVIARRVALAGEKSPNLLPEG